ncbi:MAG: Holliday junction branch migration protein RuvA, partial [Clostridia bacterium]|nr:Holliday junction branch migration protein RuvA [Clostridia bacterium]
MFHYFNGKLAYCALNTAVLDCGGVGYKFTVSATTFSKIAGHIDQPVKLYSYLAVREDAMELYGFSTEEELDAYKMLIGVSGIGPKAAIAILSIFTPQKLAEAIAA